MVKYDPFSDEVMKQDPLPIYKQLRDEAPAYYLAEFDAWALSRFEDVWKASADIKHFTATKGTTSAHLLTKVQPPSPMINLMDPPQHSKLRSQLRGYFAAPEVAKMEPMIRGLATKCLDEKVGTGRMDVMADLSSQVAVTVACSINGLPVEDGPMLNDLVWRFFAREEGTEGMTADGLAALDEMGAYFYGQVVKRRNEGLGEDVLSELIKVEIDGERLPDEAIASHLSMLIIGGAETFPKTFANLVRRLGEHPDQRRKCVENPDLIPDAYNEGLRYDMPTQFLMRETTADVEFHGKTFRPGQPVLFLYHSANHDEREFPDPDSFDIERRPKRIASFGYGPHSCLGVNVARLEGKICTEELLKRIPEYEVQLDEAERLVTDFVQGYWSLPITF